MRHLTLLLMIGCCLSWSAFAAGNVAAPHKAPSLKASGPQAGCLNISRPLSHTAYVPTLTQPPRCGRLLSTDTLLSVRHWDHT